MHASVTTAEVNLDSIDEIAPLYQRFLPTLRAANGWLGVYVMVDRTTGRGHVVGLWETGADAEAFETSGEFQRLLAEYPMGILAGPPARHIAEVLFQASL